MNTPFLQRRTPRHRRGALPAPVTGTAPQQHEDTALAGLPEEVTPAVRPLPVFPSVAGEEAAMAEARAEFRAITPRPASPADPEVLRRLRDGLRNLPDAGGPQQGGAPPSAWLVYVMPDGTRLRYPLGLAPVYKGATVTRDGRPMAGRYLGTSGAGYILLESASAAWCEDDIAAGMAQRDALQQAAREAAEGTEAA